MTNSNEEVIPKTTYNKELPQSLKEKVADLVRKGNACLRTSAEQVIEFGNVLLQLKDLLPHGSFGRCLKEEYEMNEQTAKRYMDVARMFGDKPTFVLNLKPTVLYHLAAPTTPIEVIEKVISIVETGGKVSVADIKNFKKGANQEEEVKEKTSFLDSLSEAQKRKIEKLEKQLENKLQTLIEEAEKIQDDLEILHENTNERVFSERVTLLFKIKDLSKKSADVLKTILNPDEMLQRFGVINFQA